MDPAVGVSSPARICNKVVLPQPDEPMMPIDLPSINSRDILSRTFTECFELAKLIEIFFANRLLMAQDGYRV
jgi:hypothetical protein